jgi:glyoxylase-like metal-dependent hydrolase (beta-lactamase superfamily II)
VTEFRDNATIYAGKALKCDIVDRGYLHLFSLHQDLGLPAPQLPPFLTFEDRQNIYWTSPSNNGKTDLRLQIISTPGHSVDSIVVLDHDERVAFMGDSAYEKGPLFYSYGSDIIQHRMSIKMVEAIIQSATSTASGEKQWLAACGHLTSGVPALPLLQRIEKFIDNVLRGQVLPLPTSKDHMGRTGTRYFEADDLAMSCPIEMVEASIRVYNHE